MNKQIDDTKQRESGPSREEIETLCILHAVGSNGGTAADVANRLGLAAGLTAAVEESLQPLLAEELLEEDGGRVARTNAGDRYLADRLSALGIG